MILPPHPSLPRFSREKLSCGDHKCILNFAVICSLLVRMYHTLIAIIQAKTQLHFSFLFSFLFIFPVFLHYCSENVVPLCSALQTTGSTSRRRTAGFTGWSAHQHLCCCRFLQPVIKYQPTPPGPQGHQPHGHILCHLHRVTLGNKHESTSSMNAKRSSKAACKFSAVSSCFLIWLAPSPPGNLPLNLRLRSGVRSLLWSSPKASPLSNKCFFSKSKKETLDFSEQNLFIPSLSISFLFHNVFREYVWVRENFGSSTWRINHRIR